jgi:hypothetical protein
MTVTNCDRAGVIIDGRSFTSNPIKFAGAGTLLEGTILARDTSDLTLIPFVKGGTTNGDGIPLTVLPCELTATGAGNLDARVPTDAEVRFDKLVIDADGDNSNVDAAVRDQLQDKNIVVEDVTDLSELDNQ